MTVVEIEKAIQKLTFEDFNNLMLWLTNYSSEKWDQWDKQIEEDYKKGRLDKLINSALDDIESNNVKALIGFG